VGSGNECCPCVTAGNFQETAATPYPYVFSIMHHGNSGGGRGIDSYTHKHAYLHQGIKLNRNKHLMLHDGYSIPLVFYESIQKQITEVLPALKRNRRYTTKMLCGPEFWGLMEKGERIKTGLCLAHMVTQKLLPLTFAESTSGNAKQYRLK
jgi:hypothetical protein